MVRYALLIAENLDLYRDALGPHGSAVAVARLHVRFRELILEAMAQIGGTPHGRGHPAADPRGRHGRLGHRGVQRLDPARPAAAAAGRRALGVVDRDGPDHDRPGRPPARRLRLTASGDPARLGEPGAAVDVEHRAGHERRHRATRGTGPPRRRRRPHPRDRPASLRSRPAAPAPACAPRAAASRRRTPGATTLTVMPRGPSSRASAREKPSSAAFAVRVGDHAGTAAAVGGLRADRDDPAAVGHDLQGGPARVERGGQVQVEHAVPVGVVHRREPAPFDQPAHVVDQDVDAAAERLGRGRDGLVDVPAASQVHLERGARAAELLDLRRRRPSASWARWVTATSAPARASASATARPIPTAPPVTRARRPASASGTGPPSSWPGRLSQGPSEPHRTGPVRPAQYRFVAVRPRFRRDSPRSSGWRTCRRRRVASCPMRLATWNINSIRARTDRALAFLERTGVEVLALQETKCKDDQFPREAFEALGYEVVTSGFSQWNGVAIVSKVGIEDVEIGFPGMPTWGDPAAAEARAIGRDLRWRPGLEPVRAQRPRGRRPALRLQARLARLACATRRTAGSRPTRRRRSRSSATGTSHRSTPTCGTWPGSPAGRT